MRAMGRVATGWVMGLLLAGALGADLATAALQGPERREPAGQDAKAARRRWALAKMDEMDNERLRCRARLTKKHDVEACEANYARRFREYNEIYLEGLRD
jgi:hypothetical protein